MMQHNSEEMQITGIEEIKEETVQEERIITFKLNEELIGINIEDVTKITTDVEITPVPKTPIYILGVMNLRGNIIPVVSLKKMFNFSTQEENIESATILVVETELGQIGISVDNIEGAVKIHATDILPPPMNAIGIDPEYIKGVVMLNEEKLLILLDVKKIFNRDKR
ncbi:chemotaxis protein CheW [Hydrogenothermus marinus]|uniref:Purine-binding chemotaxis protein CheW n=1 Tax=Hydrogenothermus marinus TaxID=133270 RepID=A0A3M0BRN9_9AQUI|nr:chemotaxis protein CheW [Hydrogenothermus marinus]RMA97508.1 purine-binding chemotaxis protein CheW [Hydrogenothermus marinus]